MEKKKKSLPFGAVEVDFDFDLAIEQLEKFVKILQGPINSGAEAATIKHLGLTVYEILIAMIPETLLTHIKRFYDVIRAAECYMVEINPKGGSDSFGERRGKDSIMYLPNMLKQWIDSTDNFLGMTETEEYMHSIEEMLMAFQAIAATLKPLAEQYRKRKTKS